MQNKLHEFLYRCRVGWLISLLTVTGFGNWNEIESEKETLEGRCQIMIVTTRNRSTPNYKRQNYSTLCYQDFVQSNRYKSWLNYKRDFRRKKRKEKANGFSNFTLCTFLFVCYCALFIYFFASFFFLFVFHLFLRNS